MKILRIGDPHIKVSNLEEAENLFHFINDKILELQPNRVEILGDLFHTHAVLRLEVLEFWDSWLDVLLTHDQIEFYILVGNHDMTGDYNSETHALVIFRHIAKNHKNLKIVQYPRVEGPFAYISYMHDAEEFIDIANHMANQYDAKVLVCHQTIKGAKYENGFYAPDGIDATKLNYELIISGHVHSRQRFRTDKGQVVIYPGTAKWDTVSDANEEKGLWLVEHDDTTGAIISEEFITTENVVTPIYNIVMKEGEDIELPKNTKAKINLELIGSSKWINKKKASLKGLYNITTRITDKIKREDRQTGKSFEDYVKNIYVTKTDKDRLIRWMKENKLV